jgi:hypothetical protein
MSARKRGLGVILVAALLAAPFVPRVLRACGPYFPLDLLPTRENAVLEAPPRMSVTDGLAPTPGEKLPVEEGDNETRRTEVELAGLSDADKARVAAMRALKNGDAAYAAGEGLTPIVRDYTAGAVSYHNRQLNKAREYFTRVLTHEVDVADRAREVRVVWARYMLGNVAWLQGDTEGAAADWAATRGLVRSGYTDPLGLAVASFGDEGRLWLKAGSLAKAVALYAKQASYGSERGRASLLIVAEQALGDQALLDEGLGDLAARRLILRYLYANSYDSKAFERVLAAFEKHRVTQAEGAGLLAAKAYGIGRFELAGKLAVYESTPMTAWITGKLALRSGNRDAALRSFAEAVRGLANDPAARGRVRAESGVLRVSAGDFAQAAELFYAAAVDRWGDRSGWTDYWADLAYLAERVLTVDELLPLVDRIAPTPSKAELEKLGEYGESPAAQLRKLTARRLMRAGRHEEALRYFDTDDKLRALAKEYGDALATAHGGGWQSSGKRAKAWFAAAVTARRDGMQLLGFELAPDYAVYDGMFEGVARIVPAPAEQYRVEASKPSVDSRFHYRLTAVDHALASAEAVPHRSQAFAAILCRATSWIIDREPERAAKVYERYVKEGPLVPWAATFGRDCPEPDFEGAERRRWKERTDTVTWVYRDHPLRTAGVATLSVLAGIAWLVRGRMMRKRAA